MKYEGNDKYTNLDKSVTNKVSLDNTMLTALDFGKSNEKEYDADEVFKDNRYDRLFFVTNTDSKRATGDCKFDIVLDNFNVTSGDVVEIKMTFTTGSNYMFTLTNILTKEKAFFDVSTGKEVGHQADIYEDVCLDIARILKRRGKEDVKINYIISFSPEEYSKYIKALDKLDDELKALDTLKTGTRVVSDIETLYKDDILVCYSNYGLDIIYKNLKEFTDILDKRGLRVRGLMYSDLGFEVDRFVGVRPEYQKYQEEIGLGNAMYLVVSEKDLIFASKEDLVDKVYEAVKCVEDKFDIRACVFAGDGFKSLETDGDYVKDKDYKFIKYDKGTSLLLTDVKNRIYRYKGNFLENLKRSVVESYDYDRDTHIYTFRKNEKEVHVYELSVSVDMLKHHTIKSYECKHHEIKVYKYKVDTTLFTENELKYALARTEFRGDGSRDMFTRVDHDFDSMLLYPSEVLENINEAIYVIKNESSEEYASVMAGFISKASKEAYSMMMYAKEGKEDKLASLLGVDLKSFAEKLIFKTQKYEYLVSDADLFGRNIDDEMQDGGLTDVFNKEMLFAFEANEVAVNNKEQDVPMEISGGESIYKITVRCNGKGLIPNDPPIFDIGSFDELSSVDVGKTHVNKAYDLATKKP